MAPRNINAVLERIRPQTDGESVGIKSNIAIKGYACHCGIKAYTKDIADEDALVITRLR
jgi:Asp-tRNA(Asn)/Glu-tRNA(Gln) amidotransferase A subunit family amidase